MAGTITHQWNGTVLTITSDSGTSSMDLQGKQGDTGIRGPQGPAGVVYSATGSGTDLSGYATIEYVDNRFDTLDADDIDMTGYATINYVDTAVANAQLGGGEGGSGIDLTNYATKAYVDDAIADIPSPDLSSYATQTWVANTYATMSFVNTNYAKKSDLDTYYTKSQIDAKFAALPQYASSEEVDY